MCVLIVDRGCGKLMLLGMLVVYWLKFGKLVIICSCFFDLVNVIFKGVRYIVFDIFEMLV